MSQYAYPLWQARAMLKAGATLANKWDSECPTVAKALLRAEVSKARASVRARAMARQDTKSLRLLDSKGAVG